MPLKATEPSDFLNIPKDMVILDGAWLGLRSVSTSFRFGFSVLVFASRGGLLTVYYWHRFPVV